MAKHITTDGNEEVITPNDGIKFTLEELQTAVGGLIEIAPMVKSSINKGKTLLVNEEGLCMGLPVNPLASLLAGYPIVGDALLLEEGEWD
jgi:hypothetical protein